MSEPEVAPYGGLLTKSLDEEKEREAKLQEQSIEVNVNNVVETVRPEALHLRGVDTLSTDDIKAYIDYYINYLVKEVPVEGEDSPTVEYEALPIDQQLEFRVQWVSDTSVNIVFKTMEQALDTLQKLSISLNQEMQQEVPEMTRIQDAIQEREAKPFSPVIQFRKHQNLSNRLGISTDESSNQDESKFMDEDESSVVLYTRLSFQSDRKVKNARAYSRYYLLHGEPERKPHRGSFRGRGAHRSSRFNKEDDLFAEKLRKVGRNTRESRESREGRGSRGRHRRDENDDDDLFADKLKNLQKDGRDRSRSPMRID